MTRIQIFKIISIVLGIAFSLLAAEFIYRIYHRMNYEEIAQVKTNEFLQINEPNQEKTLGQVIRLSSEPKIIYELIPNSSFQFNEVKVNTNQKGFRDKDYDTPKKKGKKRVIGIGDSVMFGWGMEEGQHYLDQLERKLNESIAPIYEVINTAVPGYNTVLEVETLKQKVDLTEVDWVIINFVSNDFDLPNFIRKRPKYLSLKKSLIIESFRSKTKAGLDNRLRDAPFDQANRRFESNPDNIPEEYADLVGEQGCVTALQELRDLSQQYGFKVLFLSHSPFYDMPPTIQRAVDDFGFIYADLKGRWQAHKAKHPDAVWQIAPDDFHPSMIGHQLISEVLFAVMSQQP